MKQIKSIMRTAFLAVVMIVVGLGVGTFYENSPSSHTIGTKAAYIAGKACTINTELVREVEQVRRDAEMCLSYHKLYRKIEQYRLADDHPKPETVLSVIH